MAQAVFWTTGSMARTPGKDRFVIHPKFRDHVCRPASQSPTEWVTKAISGIKCAEHEANYSPPSSAEFKSNWSYASTNPYDFWFSSDQMYSVLQYTQIRIMHSIHQ